MILRPRYRIEDLDQYLAKRDYAGALAAIAEALKKQPENFNLLLRQAEILGMAGDRGHAVEVYRKLARHFAKVGRYSMAIAVTNKILRLDPGQTEAAEELRQLLAAQQEEEEKARARLQQLARLPQGYPSPPGGTSPPSPSPPPPAPAPEAPVVQFFSAFPRQALSELLGSTSVRSYPPGAVIVREGELGDSLFLIVDGSVVVEGTDPRGQKVRLATLKQGDFFGEVAVLTGKPRTATVIAQDAVTVIEISRETLQEICQRHPEVSQVLDQFYQERANATVELMLARLRKAP
ncbi:MAG: cyclic nucleotide-binding domain-containing protein [Thermoanaerobaculum sp.]|nr:cyclic nucleotide-binding domain-containing protein [Thermoanaerobaculum sp.]MDW7967369.1 cyclic nucleotide-binding domain-containing protein [Thermoanaerobaculum sp.]